MKKRRIKSKIFLFAFHLFVVIPWAMTAQAGDTLLLSLDYALTLAKEHSIELTARKAGLSLAKTGYSLDIRRFLPSVSVSYNGNSTVVDDSGDTYGKQISFALRQPITDGGKSFTERKLQRIELSFKEEEVVVLEDALNDETWKLYQAVSMEREKYRLQKEALALARQQMVLVEIKLRQGSVTRLEYLKAGIQVKTMEKDLTGTLLNLSSQEFSFLLHLGLPPDTIFSSEDPGFYDYQGLRISATPETLYGIALRRNLDIRSSAFAVRKQEAEIRLLRRRFFPAVSLETNIGFSGNSFPLSEPSYSVSLSIAMSGLSSPVSSTGSIGGTGASSRNRAGSLRVSPLEELRVPLTLRQGELALRETRQNRERKTMELDYSIADSLKRYELLKSGLSLERETLDLLRQELNLLQLKWKYGEVTHSEVLSAFIKVSEKEIAILSEIMDVKLAERKIEQLAGLSPGELRYYAEDGEEESP